MPKNTKESKQCAKKKQAPKWKNVLAYPFPQYWPEITAEQTDHLKTLLLSLKETQNDGNASNKNVLIGLSKILRTINQNTRVYFFLSTDIKPKFVTKQIINLTLSKYKSCKVLCVPNLNKLTKLMFGIESIAFGYKNGGCPQIENWIEDTQKNHFPVSEKILNYYTRDMNRSDVELKRNVTKTSWQSKKELDVSPFHLRRTNNERAFIPRNADKTKPMRLDELEAASTEWTDFISLSVNTSSRVHEMEVDDNDGDDDDIEFEKQELTRRIEKRLSRTSNGNIDDSNLNRECAMKSHVEKLKENKQKKIHKKKHQKPNQLEYIGLAVNRIQPNPDKVRKKKKK